MRVKRYMVVDSDRMGDDQRLSQKVQELIDQGWEVFGSPFSDADGYLYQAVVEYAGERPRTWQEVR